MSIASVTINHNDETGEVEIITTGDADSKAMKIVDDLMILVADLQGNNLIGQKTYTTT